MFTNKEFAASLDEKKMAQIDASQLTREILRRSREQIAASLALLQHKAPNIWRAELPGK